MFRRHPSGVLERHPSGLFVRPGGGWPFAVVSGGDIAQFTGGGYRHFSWFQNTDFIDFVTAPTYGGATPFTFPLGVDEPHGNRFAYFGGTNAPLLAERIAPGSTVTGWAGSGVANICKLDPESRVVWAVADPRVFNTRTGPDNYGDVGQAPHPAWTTGGAYLPTADELLLVGHVATYSQGEYVPPDPVVGIPGYYLTDVARTYRLYRLSGADGSLVGTEDLGFIKATSINVNEAFELSPVKNANRYIISYISASLNRIVRSCRSIDGTEVYTLPDPEEQRWARQRVAHCLRSSHLYVPTTAGYDVRDPEDGTLIASRSLDRTVNVSGTDYSVANAWSSVCEDERLGGVVVGAMLGNAGGPPYIRVGVAQSVDADGTVRYEYEQARSTSNINEYFRDTLSLVSGVAPTWVGESGQHPAILTLSLSDGRSDLSSPSSPSPGIYRVHSAASAAIWLAPGFIDIKEPGGANDQDTTFYRIDPVWSAQTAREIYAGVTLPTGVPAAGNRYGPV